MKNIKILVLALLGLGLRAEQAAQNVGLLITSPELIEDVLSKHMGKISLDGDIADLDADELGERSGSTKPVTQVFYNGVPITNTKLSTSSSAVAGVALKQQGRWYVANQLRRAIGADIPYIKIEANNVVLDMNGTGIDGSLQATSTTATGITIDAGIQDTWIINGTINNLSGDAICVGAGCNVVILQEIRILNFLNVGVNFKNTVGTTVTNNVTLTDVNIGKSLSTATPTAAVFTGIATGSVIGSSFDNATPVAGANAVGVCIDGCKNLEFTNCNANGGTATTTGNAYGFLMHNNACSNLKFKNCSANNNTSAANTYGFYMVTPVKDSVFENSEATGNSSTGTAGFVFGFYADTTGTGSTGNQFINCSAIDNTSSTTTAADIVGGFGLNATDCNNNFFTGCKAEANNITGVTGASICAGFYASASNNCRYTDCRASGNFHSSVAGNVYGIRLTGGGSRNQVENAIANGQHNDVDDFTGIITGISFGDNESLSSIENCTVIGNAYNGAGTASTGHLYGIQLGDTVTGVDRCGIVRNMVRSTSVTAYAPTPPLTTSNAITLAGLRDWTTDSNSLIAGNTLALNGFARIEVGSAPDYLITASDLLASSTAGGLNFYLTFDNGQNPSDMIVESDVSNMQALSTGLAQWTNFLVVPQQS